MQKFYEPEEIWVVWNRNGIVSRDDSNYYLKIYMMILITIWIYLLEYIHTM